MEINNLFLVITLSAITSFIVSKITANYYLKILDKHIQDSIELIKKFFEKKIIR